MPRQARIDVEGVLQHVMVRGIEKRDIFLDDNDRSRFLDRLSNLLTKTKTDCLAWSLLSNHAHLLLRPTREKLSDMMRRLLTGYAVVFNLRYHRSGHLFQNRYKAIACEEESYLLELVRYIHLNPIRAGLVISMEQLDTNKWCGHAVLMGHALFAGQRTDEVLTRFGDDKNIAVASYRDFVAEGIALGKRDELVGGGLRRYLKFCGSNDFQAYDERILGSGEFVEQIWREPPDPKSTAAPLPLGELMERVTAVFGIDVVALPRGCKERHVSDARGAICYIAIKRLGYHGIDLTKSLGISESGVVLAARRGEALYESIPELREIV